MKKWELVVRESKGNLWLVTTKSQKLLCSKVDGVFFIKSTINLIVPLIYILSIEQI